LLGDKIEWKKSQAKADHELAVERMRREQDRLDNEAQERLRRENNEVQARLAREEDNDAQVRFRMQREKLLVNTRLKLLEMGKDPALAETLCPPVTDDF
jgi:DNA relaxase NicK